ncbi:MAG: HPF/RaiA family ribosome-associated protein [Fervidobacterium sp.]|nr:HPF/RaiA family ribosome-associated protein [Fervidobacterium sp.]
MEVRTFSKGFELTDAMVSYLEEKLEKVKRALGTFSNRTDINIEARFDKDGPYYALLLKTHINGKDIVVQEKANDVYGVMDSAVDSFEKSIKKEREFYKSYHKSNVKSAVEVLAEELKPRYELEEEEDKIDSVKRIFLANVSLEEALAQMEVMNHAFFVFRNVDTGEINMLYRKNGKYGLIEFQD